jgi:hypothetical protein
MEKPDKAEALSGGTGLPRGEAEFVVVQVLEPQFRHGSLGGDVAALAVLFHFQTNDEPDLAAVGKSEGSNLAKVVQRMP